MESSINRRRLLAAALVAATMPLIGVAQQPKVRAAEQQVAGSAGPSLMQIGRATGLSADYLGRVCAPSGMFAYRIDTGTGRVTRSYNVVRHAGAIYALAMWNRSHPDPSAVDAMARATAFLRANYIGMDASSNTLVVWSQPVTTASEASLGAAGLGLVALAAMEHARPGTVPLADMQSLGRFIAHLQKADGSFYSKYRPERGPDGDWESLYYPGEAALGLVSLYETDHSRQWLVFAGKALSYLAKSRAGAQQLPADHWVLIATAKFLPYYAQSGCPASRAELLTHAAHICRSILREQGTSPDARLDGGFDRAGRTTPTATRLEGLLAALEFLPDDPSGLRSQIEAAVNRGIAFLLRAQIPSWPVRRRRAHGDNTNGQTRSASLRHSHRLRAARPVRLAQLREILGAVGPAFPPSDTVSPSDAGDQRGTIVAWIAAHPVTTTGALRSSAIPARAKW